VLLFHTKITQIYLGSGVLVSVDMCNEVADNRPLTFFFSYDYLILDNATTCIPSAFTSWGYRVPSRLGVIMLYGEVYLIQHYVIKYVNDLREVGGFFRVLRCPTPIKLTTTI